MAVSETRVTPLETETETPGPGDVFNTGKYSVTTITVSTSHVSKPPTELLVVAPTLQGTYPVLLFFHGFVLANRLYTDLLNHIASHGYIVVAPKCYGLISFIWTSIQKEVEISLNVARWISSPGGLSIVLPEKVHQDNDKLALSGHSRGGKTAFALALENAAASKQDAINFKALIGIDPSAGLTIQFRPKPNILNYIPRSFAMSLPVGIIGTGLSNLSKGLIPPAAANGVNHSEFLNESKPPVFYALAKDYGHCDMLNEWIAKILSFFLKSGEGPKELMRKGVGGFVVAFLKTYLDGDEEYLNAIVKKPSVAPITLDPVIYIKE